MFMRRRPLLRAAAVGGGAYMVGRSAANRSANEASQEQRISDLEQAQTQPQVPVQQAPPPAPAQAAGNPLMDQLNQLAALHQSGALTDDEFATAKAKLLG
jgi:Short C-terminal domain